jgi:P-type E1-E2 ATPase
MLIASSLESKSSHPLAQAVVADYTGCVAESEANLLDVLTVNVLPGIGVEGQVVLGNSSGTQVHCIVGNEKLLGVTDGLCVLSAEINSKVERFTALYKNTGATILFVVIATKLRLMIAVADTVRSDAKDAIQTLRSSGISRIHMLTGDQQDTALFIAKSVGIEVGNVKSRLLPTDKLKWISAMKDNNDGVTSRHNKVLMIGDGINDAAALAGAYVGVAMGSGCAAMASLAARLYNQHRIF